MLVLGATGAIGRYLLSRLNAAGAQSLAVSRLSIAPSPSVRWLQGDLNGEMPDLSQRPIEVIYSVGPLDGLLRWLSRAQLPAISKLVAISSMSAVVKEHSADPQERALASSLLDSERAVMAWCENGNVDCVILRPTLIYGAGVDRSLSALAQFARRWRLFPWIPGATGLRQPVHADDLAVACLAAAALPKDVGGIYAVGGGEQLSFAAMLARLRAGLPVSTLPVPVPLAIARMALSLLRISPRWQHLQYGLIDRLQVDQVVDNEPAKRDLGWSPRDFHAGSQGGF